jgi:hypothetical protein
VICSEDGYATPMSAADERELLVAAFASHAVTTAAPPVA